MTESVKHFEIPEEGGGSACSSTSKGFVLHVEKCIDHDHYVLIDSGGDFLLHAKTNFNIQATDLNLTAEEKLITNVGDVLENVSGNVSEKCKNRTSVATESLSMESSLIEAKTQRLMTLEFHGSITRYDETIEGGMLNANKLFSFVRHLSGRITELEQRLVELEMKA